MHVLFLHPAEKEKIYNPREGSAFSAVDIHSVLC